MKTKMGRAAESSACSMQLSSRLYWLLCGANGGLDNPEKAKIGYLFHNKIDKSLEIFLSKFQLKGQRHFSHDYKMNVIIIFTCFPKIVSHNI